ncbi:DUF397 domain-containing protein [Stackebrandtia soli]|uniref:DUF397 domain-containing protein n=1 Tax=Stackebrandtia soli TaxID=1892856 RepID=UPI0039EB7B31
MTPGKWRKPSRSGNGGNCVEARIASLVEVRDSKLGDASPILSMSAEDFGALLNAAR